MDEQTPEAFSEDILTAAFTAIGHVVDEIGAAFLQFFDSFAEAYRAVEAEARRPKDIETAVALVLDEANAKFDEAIARLKSSNGQVQEWQQYWDDLIPADRHPALVTATPR